MFVAIDLSEEARSEIAALVLSLRKHGADVKWVELQNLHLTLKFLPDVEDSKQDALHKAFSPLARSFTPFQLRLVGVGGFPDGDRPRILWVGAAEGSEHVKQLAASIESVLELAGFARESRPFQVHLTVGRVRSAKKLAPLMDQIKKMPFSSVHGFQVNSLTLYRSTLTSAQPVYEVIGKFPLGTRETPSPDPEQWR